MSNIILYWKCMLLLLLLVRTISTDSQCSLQDGTCTYNINLQQSNGNCGKETPLDSASIPRAIRLNDRTVQIEQEFQDVKEDHEKRIKELETSIQKVLRSALGTGSIVSNTLDVSQRGRNAPQGPPLNSSSVTSSEGTLMSQLQGEFNKLRNSLKTRTKELLNERTTLNITLENLKETQKSLFQSADKLIDAENKVEQMKYDARILRNKLKDKTERLEFETEQLNISETKRLATEEQLYNVIRSEANLKEELGFYKYKLNQTLKELEELRKNHSELTQKHQKVKRNLRKCELDLIECYTAKTDTFCPFEDSNICGYKQDNETDVFDWEWHKGSTPSSNTGPEVDHTCQNDRGSYMYIEASGKGKGQNALMYSPLYRGLSNQCVEFYYHMFGRHVGTLTVHTLAIRSLLPPTPGQPTTESSGTKELESVWRVYGNQGNVWILARLSVPEYLAKTGYQLVFEGIVENGYEGDISIDDVNVWDGDCPTSANVKTVEITVEDNTTNSTVLSQINRYKNLLRRRHKNKRKKQKDV